MTENETYDNYCEVCGVNLLEYSYVGKCEGCSKVSEVFGDVVEHKIIKKISEAYRTAVEINQDRFSEAKYLFTVKLEE